MIRLHMIVEGQTEEAFVKKLLVDHLGGYSVSIDVRLVETSRKKRRITRGGMTGYLKAKRDVERWMKEDNNPDSYFTTMFDLYALPPDFPGYQEAKGKTDPYERVELIEEEFRKDLNSHPRFIPYIQLHEFEALLFSAPRHFGVVFIGETQALDNLCAIRDEFESPEFIDDGETTAPSKRIIAEIPAYEGQKPSAGTLIASAIGLPILQQECTHFRDWVEKLTRLPSP